MSETNTNITIDDTDRSTWDPPSDIVITSLDYGSQHRLSEDGGTAIFSFTGVAVYFWSPLWPYLVNTMVAVDGQNGECLNLQDFSGATSTNGTETQQSIPRWGVSGLSNDRHELPFRSCPRTSYTQYTPPPPSSISTSNTPTSSASSSGGATIIPSSRSKRVTAIAVGSAIGVLVLVALVILAFAYFRRRNRRLESAFTTVSPQSTGPPTSIYQPNYPFSLPSPNYHQAHLYPVSPASLRPNLPEL